MSDIFQSAFFQSWMDMGLNDFQKQMCVTSYIVVVCSLELTLHKPWIVQASIMVAIGSLNVVLWLGSEKMCHRVFGFIGISSMLHRYLARVMLV